MNVVVEPPQRTSAWEMYRAIVGIGVLCALLIVGVYEATEARIRDNEARYLQAAVTDVLPAARTTLAIAVVDDGAVVAADAAAALPVLLGFDDRGRLAGAVIAAEGMGYQDTIRVLYAYSFEDRAIVGFKVLASKETPGLGDRVEKEPHFLANFDALDARLDSDGVSLANAIVTVKQGEKTAPWQLDGITGATITSEAIGTIINDSANHWLPLIANEPDTLPRPSADGGD